MSKPKTVLPIPPLTPAAPTISPGRIRTTRDAARECLEQLLVTQRRDINHMLNTSNEKLNRLLAPLINGFTASGCIDPAVLGAPSEITAEVRSMALARANRLLPKTPICAFNADHPEDDLLHDLLHTIPLDKPRTILPLPLYNEDWSSEYEDFLLGNPTFGGDERILYTPPPTFVALLAASLADRRDLPIVQELLGEAISLEGCRKPVVIEDPNHTVAGILIKMLAMCTDMRMKSDQEGNPQVGHTIQEIRSWRDPDPFYSDNGQVTLLNVGAETLPPQIIEYILAVSRKGHPKDPHELGGMPVIITENASAIMAQSAALALDSTVIRFKWNHSIVESPEMLARIRAEKSQLIAFALDGARHRKARGRNLDPWTHRERRFSALMDNPLLKFVSGKFERVYHDPIACSEFHELWQKQGKCALGTTPALIDYDLAALGFAKKTVTIDGVKRRVYEGLGLKKKR